MRLIVHAAATIVLSAAGLAAVAVPAAADITTIRDRASDVVHEAGEDGTAGAIQGYRASLASGIDARSLRVNHTHHYVSFLIRFADLDDGPVQVTVRIRRNGETEPSANLSIAYADNRGTARPSATVQVDDVTTCRGVDLRVTPGSLGWVYARVDRSCLDDPDEIRAAASIAHVDAGGADIEQISLTRYRAPAWTPWLTTG